VWAEAFAKRFNASSNEGWFNNNILGRSLKDYRFKGGLFSNLFFEFIFLFFSFRRFFFLCLARFLRLMRKWRPSNKPQTAPAQQSIIPTVRVCAQRLSRGCVASFWRKGAGGGVGEGAPGGRHRPPASALFSRI
jgi:hypothetical protein